MPPVRSRARPGRWSRPHSRSHETDGADDVDWTRRPMTELCDHIIEHHHGYLREELPPLRELVDKVARVHGSTHVELLGVQEIFHELADELEQHMVKEEQIVFPACVALDRGARDPFPFGSVENPIGVMCTSTTRSQPRSPDCGL